MEDIRAQKRRELQSNALVRKLIGGSDEDLKPFTQEEQDLLDGVDLEHLIVIDTVVCRLNDNGEIIAPANMAERYAGKTASEITGDEVSLPKNEAKAPEVKASPEPKALPAVEPKAKEAPAFEEVIAPKEAPKENKNKKGFGKKEQPNKPQAAKPVENKKPTQTQSAATKPVTKEESKTKEPKTEPVKRVIPTHNIEILVPVQVSNNQTKAYFAAAYNKTLHKAAYAYVIKQADNTDRLYGSSFETDIQTDAVFVGIKELLEEFDKTDIHEIIICTTKEIQEQLRRNSTFIVDGYTPAAGEYLSYVKTIAQKKYIALTPRESRLDIQSHVQQIAEGLCADFAIK